MDIDELTLRLRSFAHERDWQQFHTPKNLVMAMTGEVGELTELFQWLTQEESTNIMRDPDTARQVRHEIADVLAYLLRLSDVLGIDIAAALLEKITINAEKYPVSGAEPPLPSRSVVSSRISE